MRRTTFFFITLVLSAVAAAFGQLPSAEDLLQSVVTIHTDKARGSGFVIDSSGYIVTNSHVIEGAEAAAIRTEDGEFFNRVVVVADDSERDLALLRVPAEELPALCVGTDVGVELGEPILVLGTPMGLSGTVTRGIVSARRTFDGSRMFQIDADAAPGSSGGPVVNQDGCVIGVLRLGLYNEEGEFNLAISSRYLRPLQDPMFHLQRPRRLASLDLDATDALGRPEIEPQRPAPRPTLRDIFEDRASVCVLGYGAKAGDSARHVAGVIRDNPLFRLALTCSEEPDVQLILMDGSSSTTPMVLPFLDSFMALGIEVGSFVLAARASGFEEPIWYEHRQIHWATRGAAIDMAKNFAEWARNWAPAPDAAEAAAQRVRGADAATARSSPPSTEAARRAAARAQEAARRLHGLSEPPPRESPEVVPVPQTEAARRAAQRAQEAAKRRAEPDGR